MRSRKALYNIITSLLLEIIQIISGLIIPRLIIGTYGSNVNGLVSSITQFLGYIILLEAGVGGVVRAALYRPLAKKNYEQISRIIKAAENFFKIIGLSFLGYLVLLVFLFPFIIDGFDRAFTSSLVLIIGISTFFQYYFGITYQILLQADQKQYVTTIIIIITTIINTFMVVILINLGFGIHIVKLSSTIIFIIRPILLNIYVKHKYKINSKVHPDKTAINQRWDGLGHHIAYLLHNNTDITLLTLFTNTKEVSVYSVYYMIVSNIKKIIIIFSTGLEASFGNMIAQEEKEAINRNFNMIEFLIFSLSTILFTSTATLILPFISIYTDGVTDTNYYRPLFAYLLILSEVIYCIRIPYHNLVLAAGHYRQTRNGAFAEALINILLSLILVIFLGLEGVVIGTVVAMLFRTIQYAFYLSKNILKRNIYEFIRKVIIYLFTAVVIILINNMINVGVDSYINWIILSIIVTLNAFVITTIVGFIFFSNDIKNIVLLIKRMVKRNI